jgi:flagellar motor switch protein FliG
VVDKNFSFLSGEQAQLLNTILARRNPQLLDRVRNAESISRSDAEEIVVTLSDEFTNNLDEDWEPTEYGREVNSILAQVNAAAINEWP